MRRSLSDFLSTDFAITFERMRALSGKSVRQVAELGGVDYAYLTRLLAGEKKNPSSETVMKIWIGLVFDPILVEKDPTMIQGLRYLAESATMTMGSRQLLDTLFGE